MKYTETGLITSGVGGLYTVKLTEGAAPLSGKTVFCRACGNFRHEKIIPLVGDRVEITYSDESFTRDDSERIIPSSDGTDILMTDILTRRNALIRPPIANTDVCFVTLASAHPTPMTDTTDKLLCILEHNGIEPVIIIGKSELDTGCAERISGLYRKSGFTVFVLSCFENQGIKPVKDYIDTQLSGKIAAFAGASGVGKSTLMNTLFPTLKLETSEISKKVSRGRHTTRAVSLFELENGGYIADTPGFSMLDFEHFDFFNVEDLFETFREFRQSAGKCKYTKCTHTKEEGCDILARVKSGEIPKSRHESYIALFDILKNKHPWDKK